jgi:hypothetical protein
MVQVVLTTSAILLVSILFVTIQLQHREKQPLSQESTQRAVTSLESYASEAKQLTYQAIHDRSPANYRRVYMEQLAKQTEQVSSHLSSHGAADPLLESVDSLLRNARRMQSQLEQSATETDKRKLQDAYERFDRMQHRYHRIGEIL